MTGRPEPSEPFDARFWADPGAGWDRLRHQAPVHRVITPEGPPAWLVTRAADVRAALLDPRLSVARSAATGSDYSGFDLPPALDRHLLNRDPPDHTRLRQLVAPALSPHRMDALRQGVQTRTDELLTSIAAHRQRDGVPVDLVAGFAIPLPLAVSCDLLAVPPAGRQALTGWATALLTPAPGKEPRARDTLSVMTGIVTGLIDSKRADPGDDLTSQLVTAADVGELTGDELTSMLFYLLFVWYEVSVDLLANGILTLLSNPRQMAELRQHPDQMPRAVEELLRHETPQTLATPRFPAQDIQIAGVTIPAGDTVLLGLASANRDENAFTSPETFDPARPPAPHLTFGAGIHTCLGAPLVRMQTAVALAGVIARFSGLTLATERSELLWRHGIRHRGVGELPVVF